MKNTESPIAADQVSEPSLFTRFKFDHWIWPIAPALIFVIWLASITLGHSATMEHARYWWLHDDAMISMRYAHNFARGMGLVWNPGERVEGYTNFAWTLWMSLIHVLQIPAPWTSFVVLISCLAFACAIPCQIARLAKNLGFSEWIAAFTVLWLLFSFDMYFWTASGLETIPLTWLTLYILNQIINDSAAGRPHAMTFVLIGFLPILRADSLVLGVLLSGIACALNKDRGRTIVFAAASLLLPASHTLFRYIYYHDLVPNTAYLKTTNWPGRIPAGCGYVWSFVKSYWPIILLAGAELVKTRDRKSPLLAAMICLYAAYVAYIGGDAFPHYRFFAPVLPILVLLALNAVESFLPPEPISRFIFAAICISAPLFGMDPKKDFNQLVKPPKDDYGNVRIGLLLAKNTAPDARVADTWAGAVFYFSDRYGIDMLGKMDKQIAKMPAVSKGTKPGHNKWDYAHSLGELKPDYVGGLFKLPVTQGEIENMSTGDWAFNGQLYKNEIFKQHFRPNPVKASTWRTYYVADWSKEFDKRDGWKPLK